MTLSVDTNRTDAIGDNTLSVYPYTFRILDDDDLAVIVRHPTTDVETPLVKTTNGTNNDYSVSGVGASAGTITLLDNGQAWLDGSGFLDDLWIITIRRVRPLTQTTDVRNQGVYYPVLHENAFDHLVMIAQQHQDEIDRSAKFPESVDIADFSPDLPIGLINEASVALVTNATGDGWAVGPTVTAISTAAANAAAAASSAAAALVSETAAAASAAAAAVSATSASNLGIDSQFKVFSDSPITLVSGDRGKIFSCDCTSGNIAITLPAIAGLSLTAPFSLVIKKTDSTAGTVTITRASTDTIDGATSVTLESQYEGVFLFAEDSTAPDKWTMVKFGAASAGGGGGSSLKWIASTNAPTEIVENNLVVQEFDPDTQQEIYAMIKVPQTYTAGRPIKLWFDFYSGGNSGTVLFKTTSTLIRKATDAVTSTANQYTPAGSAVTLSAGTVDEPQEVGVEITTSGGLINVAVSPGDRIFIKLFRDVANDTATATAKALLDGSEVTFR